MTGASKILTVSYGTFSCTLEGFDDPFNTMKAIAEYFRDLAAGDRYFGAEPPTPDAAMLHRIAEREIQRRVEAKIQDNGVILRAGESADLPATTYAPAEPARPALHDEDSSAESVAARLQRIRARHIAAAQVEDIQPEAPVLPAAQPAVSPAPQVAQDTYIEDQHAEDLAQADLAQDHATLIETADQSPLEIDDILAAVESETAPRAEVEPAQPDDLMPVELIAADLAADATDTLDLSTLADDTVIETVDQIIAFAADEPPLAGQDIETVDDLLPEMAAVETEEDDLPEIWQSEAQSSDDAALLARLADETLAGAGDLPAEPQALPTDAPAESLDAASLDAESLDLGEDALVLDPQDVIETPDQDSAEDDIAEMLEAADLPPETEAVPAPQPAPRARARVIRIRRADPPAAAPASALSDEAEAALQAELAALEAEIEGIDAGDSLAETPAETAAEDQAETAVAPTAEPPLGARQKIKEQTEDESVNRLMDHAKSEMDGSETRRRQSAIAHLKAAVAATVADRKLGGEGSDTASARMDAYRSDLDRVVRPRRPVAESSTPRPAPVADTAPRPTPLVLVSAQRIDRAQTASPEAAETPRVVMPVRPRRVSPPGAETAQPSAPLMQNSDQIAQENDPFDADESLADDDTDNVFGDATSFQDFADQLGASALPDLLEAAAVYCAEVLNRPEFSRPLVMRQIAGLPGQTATAREDYLRGFGTLLRQGRIAKVKRGMFALTDRSPYLAEARKQVG